MAIKTETEVQIQNRRSGKVLEASASENGSRVVQAAQTDSDAQVWTMRKNGSTVRFINKASGKALDAMMGGTENGTHLQIWEDLGAESQLWKLSGRIYKKIVNSAANKVMDISGLSDEDGAPAQLWDDIGGENQQWKLIEIEPAAVTKTVKKAAKKPAKQETKQRNKKKTTAKKPTPAAV